MSSELVNNLVNNEHYRSQFQMHLNQMDKLYKTWLDPGTNSIEHLTQKLQRKEKDDACMVPSPLYGVPDHRKKSIYGKHALCFVDRPKSPDSPPRQPKGERVPRSIREEDNGVDRNAIIGTIPNTPMYPPPTEVVLEPSKPPDESDDSYFNRLNDSPNSRYARRRSALKALPEPPSCPRCKVREPFKTKIFIKAQSLNGKNKTGSLHEWCAECGFLVWFGFCY